MLMPWPGGVARSARVVVQEIDGPPPPSAPLRLLRDFFLNGAACPSWPGGAMLHLILIRPLPTRGTLAIHEVFGTYWRAFFGGPLLGEFHVGFWASRPDKA